MIRILLLILILTFVGCTDSCNAKQRTLNDMCGKCHVMFSTDNPTDKRQRIWGPPDCRGPTGVRFVCVRPNGQWHEALLKDGSDGCTVSQAQ